jgi:hypothetical protein
MVAGVKGSRKMVVLFTLATALSAAAAVTDVGVVYGARFFRTELCTFSWSGIGIHDAAC